MRLPDSVTRQLARPRGHIGRHLTWRFLNRINASQYALVLEQLSPDPSDRVLEVGFGGAALLRMILDEIPDGSAAGLELSKEMVELADSRLGRYVEAGRLELIRGSVDSMPFPGASFDKAATLNTVYFWPDLAAGLRELARVVRPGGRLVLGFASSDDMRARGLQRSGFQLYSREELSVAVAEAGFRPGTLASGSTRRGAYFVLSAERES